MQVNERDLAYLVDIVTCCNDILEFTAGISVEQFAADKMRRLATERQLETIGEAARRVSGPTQDRLSDVPWSKIVGVRNKLAHDYGEILAIRVWQIVRENIPGLQQRLLAISEVAEQFAEE